MKTYKAYLELMKPSILFLVLITTALGYYLGGQGNFDVLTFSALLIGAGAVCAGASTLNHYLERDADCKMERTRRRPIPSGVISPLSALNFGILLVLGGLAVLYTLTNLLTAFLSLLTAFLYVLVYTPMKKLSWLNTSIGSIPGALPPVGGWTAATGQIETGAVVLFLIMFLWQHPHFYAIGWMYRADYKKGGFKMLPVVEPDGKRMFRHILYYSAILIPVSVIPTLIGLSGWLYFFGALLSGVLLYLSGMTLYRSRTVRDARALLKATVFYLPFLFALIIFDHMLF